MAFAALRDDLTCSICQEIYTDPVTLLCGHNYCLDCIGKTWNSQWEREKERTCPECREKFTKLPTPRKNLRLSSIASSLASCDLPQDGGIMCTYCIYSAVRATKSCLHCEVSMCPAHLIVHDHLEGHVLTDPTNSFGSRKCAVHGKLLECYCSAEGVSVCVRCCLYGEHRGHPVEPLDEAAERKKARLRGVLGELRGLHGNLSLKKVETFRGALSLYQNRQWLHQSTTEMVNFVAKKVSHETSSAPDQNHHNQWKEITDDLGAIIGQLQDKMARRIEKVLGPAYKPIRDLEIQKYMLYKYMIIVEEVSSMADPVAVLQEQATDEVDLAGTEWINDDVAEVHLDSVSATVQKAKEFAERLLNRIRDLFEKVPDKSSPLQEVKRQVQAVIADNGDPDFLVDVGLWFGTDQAGRRSGFSLPIAGYNHKERKYLRSICRSWIPEVLVSPLYARDVTEMSLDENTAGIDVAVSEDGKLASILLMNQRRLKLPDRFRCRQVLSTDKFSSGRHYWEVETSEVNSWRIGVAYPSITRRGLDSQLGDNDKSWGLCRKFNRYSVAHGKKEKLISNPVACRNIGILLDYEAGLLSFYELSDPIWHLHTIKATFTEPLHAAFLLNKKSWIRVFS
ncbi:hypothetical protein GDO86_013803 [Hymenochirus boettgeri]|uniref:Uncharacterized protein n=1 Tax=Hymenochirus boettgeri TaxID=247094 RepID=A0A8T2JRS4_9PIPI|nr:hypothetical protein GDO86_013803 [Hymenochirus boettgeri]